MQMVTWHAELAWMDSDCSRCEEKLISHANRLHLYAVWVSPSGKG